MNPCDDEFILPDGSSFDHSIGLGDDLPSLPFGEYGKFLRETKKCLARFGLRPRAVKSLSSVHAEVGDDEIDVSSHPINAAACTVVYQVFLGMKVSEHDTSINPRFGNFAEDLVIVPDGYEQTYRFAQQTSDFKNMAFLDVPKLRLAIDVRPGRMNHSATNDGKAGILGSRLAWLPRSAPVRCLWEVFNLFQDINLGLIRDDKFAYLPTALGGYGKPVAFGKASNFEAFCTRYKQGTHAGLARELVRRTNRRFHEYTVEHRYNTDEVLSAVSRLQSSWHDWVKGKSLYAPTCWLDAPPEVAEHRVIKHGNDAIIDASLRRLVASGHLVTESDLAIAYEHNELCKFLISSETHEQFLARKEEKRKEWLNLSTFSLRLYGLLQPLRVDQSLQGTLPDADYRIFWQFITSRKLNLRTFLRAENLYDRAAKDSVYANGPMAVRSLDIYPKVTQMGRRFWYQPTTDRLDDIETPEELNLLYEWVKGDPLNTLPPSRRLLEDDDVIMREVSRSGPSKGFAIITDDIALCRRVFTETRKWVCRIPVKWYYMAVYYTDNPSPWQEILETKFPFYEWVEIQDTGSIESYEETNFRDGLPLKWPQSMPFDMKHECFTHDGRRKRPRRVISEPEDDPDWKPYRFPEGYLFTPGTFLQRRKHPHRRGWA